ncbi:MAG: hypothetical protein ACP5N9_00025 [Candidatus Bilamarchaeum sp.]
MSENKEQVINEKRNSYKDFNWESVGLDFGNWEEEKLWALDLPKEEMDIEELLWHFDAPFWTDDNSERWTVSPWDVIKQKEGTVIEQARMEKADLSYPIDIMKNHGRWIVLDGLHRLAKAYKQGQKMVTVRIVPRERFPEIASDHPIELPNKNNNKV